MGPTILDNVVIVLDEPKDVVNVAGVIRVMKNMGLSKLRLRRGCPGACARSDNVADWM